MKSLDNGKLVKRQIDDWRIKEMAKRQNGKLNYWQFDITVG
jgi:hypothetical protein